MIRIHPTPEADKSKDPEAKAADDRLKTLTPNTLKQSFRYHSARWG